MLDPNKIVTASFALAIPVSIQREKGVKNTHRRSIPNMSCRVGDVRNRANGLNSVERVITMVMPPTPKETRDPIPEHPSLLLL